MTSADFDDFTYPDVGATSRTILPGGYHHVRRERVFGKGEECFTAAAERLLTWEMHRGAGLRVQADSPRAIPDAVVVMTIGFWPLRRKLPCRVVDTIEMPRSAGFSYGTLPGHLECGEERFVIEWRQDDGVAFVVTAFSRPALWWVRLGGPVTRWAQSYATGRYLRAIAAERRP